MGDVCAGPGNCGDILAASDFPQRQTSVLSLCRQLLTIWTIDHLMNRPAFLGQHRGKTATANFSYFHIAVVAAECQHLAVRTKSQTGRRVEVAACKCPYDFAAGDIVDLGAAR